MRSRLAAGAVAVLLAVAGCGGDEGGAPEPRATAEMPAIPDEIDGLYSVVFDDSDLPTDAPPELAGGRRSWSLDIKGGRSPDEAGSLAISSEDDDFVLLTVTPIFEDDRMTLKDEPCVVGGKTEVHDNVYEYELERNKLTFTAVSNKCANKAVELILTNTAWRKAPETCESGREEDQGGCG